MKGGYPEFQETTGFRLKNCRNDYYINESDLMQHKGRVAELADALDLGSSGATHGGSIPSTPTIK